MQPQLIHTIKTLGMTLGGLIVIFLVVGFLSPSTELTYDQKKTAIDDLPQQSVIEKEAVIEPEVKTPINDPQPQTPPIPKEFPVTSSPAQIIEPVEPPRYSYPPLPLEAIPEHVSPAIVNILCTGRSGSFSGVSGSGIVIDPRGVILTNAHVAQYFLLSDYGAACTIRVGAPAKERYTAELIFIPKRWAEKHAGDLIKEQASGTGEHDWALLRINGRTDGSEPPAAFAFVSTDTREHITRKGEPVLLSSYPAGFLGGITIRKNLWPLSTVTTIKDVFTFETGLVDVLSLGGTIVAQSGSSGGAVVNQWGKLVGLIVTASEGATTEERDLRAMTLAHIERSMFLHMNVNLAGFLSGSLDFRAQNFQENIRPFILEYFSEVLQ